MTACKPVSIVLALPMLLLPISGRADTINVPGDYPTIQAAVANASNGDEIIVAPGTYYGSVNLGNLSIKLRSSGGPEVTTIDGTGFNGSVVQSSGSSFGQLIEGFTVTGGSTLFGGGIRLNGASQATTVSNCIFVDNTAENSGGGMYINGGKPLITNCFFTGNESGSGGGIYDGSDGATIMNSVFVGNSTSGDGGGIAVVGAGNDTIIANCIFDGNMAFNGGGGNFGSDAKVINSVFVGNTAQEGGGVWGTATFMNCTIAGNTAALNGGGIRIGGNVTNCVVWGNTPNEIAGNSSTVVSFTDVGGGFSGQGNIDVDPLFANAAKGDLRLLSTSPCIDAGNSIAYLGPFVDLDGQTRGVDVAGAINSGIAAFGSLVVIDMGAYESQAKTPSCPADQTGDGVVNASDLALLLGAWGTCD